MFSLRISITVLISLLLITLLAGCGGERTFSSAKLLGKDWRLISSGSDNTLNAVAWSGSRFVAVGDRGIIRASTDGIKWTDQISGTGVMLRDVAWCDSLFVAVGGGGTVLRSTDGLTWEDMNVPSGNALMSVAAGNGHIATVGANGSYYVSEDGGASWANQPHFTTDLIIGIVWDNDQWLACTGMGSLFSSTDGSNWTEIWVDIPPIPAMEYQIGIAGCRDIVATDIGFFISVEMRDPILKSSKTMIFGSDDGLHWDHRATIDERVVGNLAWTGSEVLALGTNLPTWDSYAGSIYSSTDGTNWVEQRCGSPLSLNGAVQGNDRVVVVGDKGYILMGTNASNLTVQTSGAAIVAVVWDGSKFVAATGYGSVMISTNGTDWVEYVADGVQTFWKLFCSGESYVAVDASRPARTYYSDDAINWSQATGLDNFNPYDAIWAYGKFVAVGRDGNIAVSDNGADWIVNNVGDTARIMSITQNDSQFVALSYPNIYTSTNGHSWISQPINMPRSGSFLFEVAWSGANYVAFNIRNIAFPPEGQIIFYSEDGVNWEIELVPVFDLFQSVEWTGSEYVIVGENGALVTSPDGKNWTQHETGTDNHLRDIASGPDRWVVVGNQRTVLVSP